MTSDEPVVHSWDWWAYQFRVTYRRSIRGMDLWDDSVVAFLRFALDLQPGQRLLDVPCGAGPHALRLAGQGYHVTGLDISPRLIAHCREQAALQGVTQQADFLVGDMRTLPFTSPFDAGYLYSASFGFFDMPGDRAVLDGIARSLRPGGRFVIDCLDPQAGREMGSRKRHFRPEGIYELDSAYDPATFTLSTQFYLYDREGNTHVADRPETVRLYEVDEMRALCAASGLQVLQVYGTDQPPYLPYGPDCNLQMLLVVARPD
ncbi:MAG: methyltransferase domain-containing protein [Chloroflexi bacterium]|nr:methyltransferase domain-containing protein [Chloroflexota bacterium]